MSLSFKGSIHALETVVVDRHTVGMVSGCRTGSYVDKLVRGRVGNVVQIRLRQISADIKTSKNQNLTF